MKYEKSCGAVVFHKRNDGIYFLIEEMKQGHFAMCKGHVENDENEHQTAEREILEETDVKVNFIYGFRDSVEYSPYRDTVKTVIYFLASADDETCKPQLNEVKSILWLPYREAYDKLTFNSDKKVLEKAHQFLIDKFDDVCKYV